MSAPVLAAVEFYPPAVNPAPGGLFTAVNWTDEPGPTRFLSGGVRIRPINYGAEDSVGIWTDPWCQEPGSPPSEGATLKFGVRPLLPEAFTPITTWAYDECDASAASRAEVETRVQQNYRLMEPVLVEFMFAEMLSSAVAQAGIAVNRDTVREAVAYLEGQLAKTNTLGVLHASPEAAALEWGLVLPSGGVLRSPLGHQWVFGGGYVDMLGDLIVATSPVYGWRGPVTVRPVLDQQHNTYAAVAERSVVLGYERLIGAVNTDVINQGS